MPQRMIVSDKPLPYRRPPPDACDCHMHVNGDPAIYPQSPERSFTAEYVPLSEYFAAANAAGLERLVVVQPSYYGTDNRSMLDAMAALEPGRRRGVASIDEATSLQELRRLNAIGVRAARFNMVHGSRHSVEKIAQVARRIAPLGWHIEVYAEGGALADLAPKLSGLPTDVVIDHMGKMMPEWGVDHPSVRALLRMLEAGRCWVKVMALRASSAGHPFQDVEPLARLLIASAGERCLWGSDWPHTGFTHLVPPYAKLLTILAGWSLGDAAMHRILVENPIARYGFPPAAAEDGHASK
jgi:D-galactarolactone isomerase